MHNQNKTQQGKNLWKFCDMYCVGFNLKLRSHMRGAVAERRRADFDIPAPLPRVCSHIRGADAERTRSGCGADAEWTRSGCGADTEWTRSGRGRICHFLKTMMVWSVRFRSGRGKLSVGPISCGADFAPAPPLLRDRACVNTCNDLCWSQFSARLGPRPPAHVWMYLNVPHTWSLPQTALIWKLISRSMHHIKDMSSV